MHILSILLNPGIMALVALLLSIVWMLRDEKDKTRIGLVLALTLNLFYCMALGYFMGREDTAFPWKYDHVLAGLDGSLGLRTAWIARPLQGRMLLPLQIVYDLILPAMIAGYLLTRYRRCRGSIVLAYVAELISGPLLYAIVPACGPVYAFGKQWLHPPAVRPEVMSFTGNPNAFPSLHVGTALVLLTFAPGKFWRPVAMLFFVATCVATLATGEHYVVDLAAGLAFGTFVSAVGMRNYKRAGFFLGLTLVWSLAVRFAYPLLLAHPILLRSLAGLTLVLTAFALGQQWKNAYAAEPVQDATVC